MADRETIRTSGAPEAIGPYAQAIATGNMVFCSGQIPLDPDTGKIVKGSIEKQTERVMENLKATLEAAGSNLSSVVKTTVFLKDLKDYDGFNKAYSDYFPQMPPAREAIQVAAIPKGARVEISAIAVR